MKNGAIPSNVGGDARTANPRGGDALDDRIEPAPIQADASRSQLVAKVQPPPPSAPIVVTQYEGHILGERVIWQSPKGWHFDVRATSEPYHRDLDTDSAMIDIVAEVDWYRGLLLDSAMASVAVFAHTVFVERPSTKGAPPER